MIAVSRSSRMSYSDISCNVSGMCAAPCESPWFLMSGWGRGRHGHRFGPRGGFGSFFVGPGGPRARRGDVRAAALLLLAEGPANGYQLMQEIEKRSDGVWRPSPGSIYPALAQLEDEGLVRTEAAGEGRTYVLTDAGRAYVEERRGELRAPWDEMSGSVDEDVSGLFGELRRVGMAAVQISQAGGSDQVARARGVLADARRALYGLLAEDDTEK
jgi:DNA-binding PadR family transcriptional regulator